MKKTIIAIALTGLLLSGCVIKIGDDYEDDSDSHSSWSKIEKENRQKISELSPGSAISMVRLSMGVPAFDELIVKDSKEYRVLLYRTQRIDADGITSKDECTPVLFANGELIGFGSTALDAI
jgi:hypothetical protein